MSKIFGYYSNDVDRFWYDSSNVKYSECIDHDNAKKTLYILFNSGKLYKYTDVNVQDYLLFREDSSQGKALNKYIKARGYQFESVGEIDMAKLEEELDFRNGGGVYLEVVESKLRMYNCKDELLYESPCEVTDEMKDMAEGILKSIGVKISWERRTSWAS